MSVDLVFSYTNGGAAISGNVDHGNISNGLTTTAIEVFIRHTGINSITACGLYVRQYSGTYNGDASAALDIAELLAWGDASTSASFGGFQINMDATGAYSASAWPTYSSKSPTNGFVCRTGIGDSEANAVSITTATGATATGTIQAGSSPNVRLKCRVQVPSDEDTVGVRQFDQVVVFTYTS